MWINFKARKQLKQRLWVALCLLHHNKPGYFSYGKQCHCVHSKLPAILVVMVCKCLHCFLILSCLLIILEKIYYLRCVNNVLCHYFMQCVLWVYSKWDTISTLSISRYCTLLVLASPYNIVFAQASQCNEST